MITRQRLTSADSQTNVNDENIKCVLLADRHHGLTESVRGLLETVFDAVVMVADQSSLLETARRLEPTLAVVDLSLARGDNLVWLGLLRQRSPRLKIVALSVHDEPSVLEAALKAGADSVVLKRAIATELLPAVDAAMSQTRNVAMNAAEPPDTDTAGSPRGPQAPEHKRTDLPLRSGQASTQSR